MAVNYTHCGNHFTIITRIKSLCCTPYTNTMFYVNYISINWEKKALLKHNLEIRKLSVVKMQNKIPSQTPIYKNPPLFILIST